MELKSRGYAEWARYISLGYHPNQKQSALSRLLNFIFIRKDSVGNVMDKNVQ